jgi:hypothetical protein
MLRFMQTFTLFLRRSLPLLFLLLLSSAAAWAQPNIGSLSPMNGDIGTTVTISGSGFTGVTGVRFGELAAKFTINSASQITATVPRVASTQRILITSSFIGPTGQNAYYRSASPFTVTRASSSLSYGLVASSFAGVNVGANAAPAVGDLDNDNLLDLLVGRADGTISRYEQTVANGPNFTSLGLLKDASNATISVGSQSTVAIMDINSDGRFCLFLGRGDGTVSEYKQTALNAATFALVEDNFAGISTPSNTMPCMTDLDGDGNLEMLVGKGDGIISHFEQSGSPNADGFYRIDSNFNAIQLPGNNAPFCTDLDGDGQLDLLMGVAGGNIYRYEQTGANSFSMAQQSSTFSNISAGTNAKPYVTDIDGDGLLDLLVGRGDGTIDRYEQGYVPSAPSISNFSPTSGPVGTSVTVTGSNLSGVSAVRVSGMAGAITGPVTATSFTFTVGSGSSTGTIGVTTPGGTATSTGTFTVTGTNAAPTDISLSNASVAENQPLNTPVGTFSTTDAQGGTFAYTFAVGGVDNGSFNILSGTTLTTNGSFDFETKSSYSIKIRSTDAGGLFFEKTFTITVGDVNETPTITSFTPTSGPVGTSGIVVTGTNFTSAGAATVKFNGTTATATVNSNTQLTATVPSGATTGRITVQNADGTGTSPTDFTVTPPVTLATVTTATPGSVTSSSAVLGGTVTNAGNGTVTERGAVYLLGIGTPSTANTKVTSGSGTGSFGQTVSGLPGNTLYSVRAYAINGAGTSYGATLTFTTDNNPPVAVNDSYTVAEDSGPTAFSVLSNDTDSDAGTTLIIMSVTQPANGTVTSTSTSVSFTPTAGFVGSTNFTYTISDGNGGTDVGTVTVAVTAVNDPAVLTASSGSTAFTAGSGAVAVDAALTATDVDNPTLASGTVFISTGLVAAQDVLGFSNTSSTIFGNIVATYTASTGTLALTSSGRTATVAQWQAALRAVTYNNTSGTPTGTSRVVNFRVNDGTANSNTVTKTISLATPTPTITSLSPSSGPVGATVIITGSNFTGATAVRFNGLDASSYVINSSSQITAVVAPGTTSGAATVITAFGTSNGPIFSITSATTSTTLASSANPSTVGQSVTFTATVDNTNGSATPAGTVSFRDGGTILGSGTLDASGVATFSTSALTQGSHSILAIYLGRTGFSASTSATLTQVVDAPPTPAITNLSPNSGPVGTSVTITGTDLGGASSVSFNGVAQTTITGNTGTSLTVSVPAGATTGNVTVTAPSGTSNALTFTVTPPAPVVTSVTGPANGTYRIGQFVTFLVSFDQAVTVSTAGGTPVMILTIGSTPRGLAYFSGSNTNTLTFRYLVQAGDLDTNGVTLGSSIAANNGTLRNATGTDAVLMLNNVASLTGVLVDGVVPTATVTTTAANPSSTSLLPITFTFSEPVTGLTAAGITVTNGTKGTLSGSGTTYTLNVTATASGPVTVLVSAGAAQDAAGNPNAASSTLSVTYTPPPVSITSFTPTSGAAGTDVVITGTGFNGATSVTINNVAVASYTVDSNTQITATVSASNTTGLIRVTAPAGSGVSSTNFIVGPAITGVTATGNNTFRAGQTLTFFVAFSQAVTVSTTGGTPTVALTVGSTVRNLPYFSGSGTTALQFRYVIVAGDLDTDGVTLSGTGIDLNGGTIRNSSAVNADLDFNNVVDTSGLLVDAVAPTVTISSTAASPTSTSPIPVTITFSEPVTGFVATDITVTNGTKGTLSGSGTTYTINITPTAAGTVTVNLGANVAQDAATNGNVAAPQFSITYAPAPVITSLTPSSGPVGQSVVIAGSNFTGATGVTFNSTVAASYVVNSATSITAVVAAGTTTGAVVVTSPSGSSNTTFTFTVTAASTSTALASSVNPSVFGQSVTFTATVTNTNGSATPAGAVTFKDGSTTLGTGTLSAGGVATYATSTLTVGSHTITAVYGAAPGFNTSTSAAVTQVVNAAATSTTLISSLNPSTSGQSVTFTATVAATAPGTGTPTGTITFKDGSTTLGTGTISGGVATYATSALSAGSHSITAVYGASGSYATSTSAVLTQVVNAAPAPGPTVTGLSASAELPGMPVVITGTGFTSGSTVSFGGVAAAGVTFTSATSLTAVVPASAPVGSSVITVTTGGQSSASAPGFAVLKVYDAVASCLSTVPYVATGDGSWHYLLAPNGQVVAALQDTRAALGSVSLDFLVIGTAGAVRQDGRGRQYLDRNWHLTASNSTFTGSSVNVRFYGLVSEFTRLQAVDASVSYATLKTTQYSGLNEDCALGNNSATGEARTLPLAASTPGNGVAWFVAEASVPDHFSEFYLTGSSSPLPVELSAFTAEAKGSDVRLGWTTASEKNSARFEVERSLDGRAFERIGTVEAAGSSSALLFYTFFDTNLRGHQGTLYYRLRQVDQDGTASYSPVRTVASGPAEAPALTAYPVPARAGQQLRVAFAPAGASVEMFDALGRCVAHATAAPDGTALLDLPRELPAGVYLLRSARQSRRLMVE